MAGQERLMHRLLLPIWVSFQLTAPYLPETLELQLHLPPTTIPPSQPLPLLRLKIISQPTSSFLSVVTSLALAQQPSPRHLLTAASQQERIRDSQLMRRALSLEPLTNHT